MDIKIKHKPSEKQPKIWIAVLVCMVIIIAVWVAWIYPKSMSLTNNAKAQADFINFKNKISESLSIFKRNKPQKNEQVDVQDLRERVFGDSKSKL